MRDRNLANVFSGGQLPNPHGGLTARATYDAPRELAAGVSLVIVNGAVTWHDGRAVTTGFPGRLVS